MCVGVSLNNKYPFPPKLAFLSQIDFHEKFPFVKSEKFFGICLDQFKKKTYIVDTEYAWIDYKVNLLR